MLLKRIGAFFLFMAVGAAFAQDPSDKLPNFDILNGGVVCGHVLAMKPGVSPVGRLTKRSQGRLDRARLFLSPFPIDSLRVIQEFEWVYLEHWGSNGWIDKPIYSPSAETVLKDRLGQIAWDELKRVVEMALPPESEIDVDARLNLLHPVVVLAVYDTLSNLLILSRSLEQSVPIQSFGGVDPKLRLKDWKGFLDQTPDEQLAALVARIDGITPDQGPSDSSEVPPTEEHLLRLKAATERVFENRNTILGRGPVFFLAEYHSFDVLKAALRGNGFEIGEN